MRGSRGSSAHPQSIKSGNFCEISPEHDNYNCEEDYYLK